jgi:hypothetical protein
MAKLFPLAPTAAVIRSVEFADRPDRSRLVAPVIASYWHASYWRIGGRGRLAPSAACLDGTAFRRSFWGLP